MFWFRYSPVYLIGTGTLWTTGQVGAIGQWGSGYKTSIWRTGYDNRTAGGKGVIQLVTPTVTRWYSSGGLDLTGQTGLLRIQVPEPGAVLLLLVGAGVLVGLHRVSRRV
jgi:hypothetical protein